MEARETITEREAKPGAPGEGGLLFPHSFPVLGRQHSITIGIRQIPCRFFSLSPANLVPSEVTVETDLLGSGGLRGAIFVIDGCGLSKVWIVGWLLLVCSLVLFI